MANYCNKNSLYTAYLLLPPPLSCADTSCLHPQVYVTPQRLHTASGRTIYPSADLNVVSVPCTCAQVLYFTPCQVHMCVCACVVCILHPTMYVRMYMYLRFVFRTLSCTCVHRYMCCIYFEPHHVHIVLYVCISNPIMYVRMYVHVLYVRTLHPVMNVCTCVVFCTQEIHR